MEAFKFTKVRPGDILVLDYNLVPGGNALASIDEAILSEGLTGTWLEPYKKFKVATVSKSCNITLKANVLDFSKLALGDTFKFGKYQVESETPWAIEWEIVHQTDDYQIAQTKQIIDLRAFDAKESTNTDNNRSKYGNNNWQYSNIKQFLNSDQATWYSAQHSYDAPPNSSNCYQYSNGTTYNAYDTHKGFLYYFSDEEKSLLKDMTLTLANNTKTDGGGSYTWTGKVWLPTYTQMSGNKNNSISEGTKFDKYSDDNSRIKTIHENCAKYNEYCKINSYTSGRAYWYWMSSAYPSYSYYTRSVNSDGDPVGNFNACCGGSGLAPCICLPRSSKPKVSYTIMTGLNVSSISVNGITSTQVPITASEGDTIVVTSDTFNANTYHMSFSYTPTTVSLSKKTSVGTGTTAKTSVTFTMPASNLKVAFAKQSGAIA